MAERAEKWLTLRQARERLAEMEVTDQTIRNWGDSGKLRITRTAGRQRRFAASSVEQLLADYRRGLPNPPADAPPADHQ